MPRIPKSVEDTQPTLTDKHVVSNDASPKKRGARPGVKNIKPQPTLTDDQAQAGSQEQQAASGPDPLNGRRPDGKFARGNPGGPGNPHARHCARMLQAFRNAISAEEMQRLFRVLYEKAAAGDVSAGKLVLSYHIGKPLPASNPDAIDRDEWNHYQQDSMALDEMKRVLSSLPTRVGNDIARTTLPIMTEAWTKDLATQLMKGCPVPKEVHERTEDGEEKPEVEAPIANGELNESDGIQPSTTGTSRSTNGHHNSRRPPTSTTKKPIANGDSSKRIGRKKMGKRFGTYTRKNLNGSRSDAPIPNEKLTGTTRNQQSITGHSTAAHESPPGRRSRYQSEI
jgi:hypothetical protein